MLNGDVLSSSKSFQKLPQLATHDHQTVISPSVMGRKLTSHLK